MYNIFYPPARVWVNFSNFELFSGSEVKCPPGFPNLDRKTGSNHGDVCRNDLIHGLNQGWNCVAGCCGQNSDPWCVMSGTTNSPCRVDSDQCNTLVQFERHICTKT